MRCELCGKETELFTAVVEGAQMQVCAACGSFGKVLRRAAPPRTAPVKQKAEPVQVERLVEDYGQRIRVAREKRNLTQADFAKLIQLKESLVHKLETGHFEPTIEQARKLEHALGIALVETREETMMITPRKDGAPAGLTIGDILKLKQKPS
jgi:putative transcription factor